MLQYSQGLAGPGQRGRAGAPCGLMARLMNTVLHRETREGWPLLTVETEVNGDSKNTNGRSPSLVVVHWACCADTREFRSTLAGLVGPVQNIFFFTIHYLNSFVPVSWAGSRAESPVS